MNKKGQMQTYESILVIFVFVIILFLGMIIFYKFTAAGIEKEVFEFELEKFYNMIGYFPGLSEVSCSYLGDKKDCMDILKLLGVGEIVDYGNKEISVEIIYPEMLDGVCDERNIGYCNKIIVYEPGFSGQDYIVVNSPVSLYNALEDVYYVGLLEIRWYK
jgi:hypothetical protein